MTGTLDVVIVVVDRNGEGSLSRTRNDACLIPVGSTWHTANVRSNTHIFAKLSCLPGWIFPMYRKYLISSTLLIRREIKTFRAVLPSPSTANSHNSIEKFDPWRRRSSPCSPGGKSSLSSSLKKCEPRRIGSGTKRLSIFPQRGSPEKRAERLINPPNGSF